LPGCPYRRTPSYQSTRRVVVFDLEGTGAAWGVRDCLRFVYLA